MTNSIIDDNSTHDKLRALLRKLGNKIRLLTEMSTSLEMAMAPACFQPAALVVSQQISPVLENTS